MNKAQLIDALAQRLNGDKRVAAEAVEEVVDIVVRTVQSGDHVTITGFGVFEKRSRAARVARNPRTGETVHVAPTSVPAFRPGAQFKAVVAGEKKLTADTPAVKRAAAGQGSARPAAGKRVAATRAPAKKAAPATKLAAKKTAPAKKSGAAKTLAAPTKGKKESAKKAGKSKK
jgi:DNA-binding protein HU-beta